MTDPRPSGSDRIPRDEELDLPPDTDADPNDGTDDGDTVVTKEDQ